MKETDLAYIAGFIDGEGYVGYTKRRDRQKRNPNHINLVLNVRVTNTNYALLLWLRDMTGTGNIVKLKGMRFGQKTCYQWYCYGDNARELLRQLKPYLKIKAGQGFLI